MSENKRNNRVNEVTNNASTANAASSQNNEIFNHDSKLKKTLDCAFKATREKGYLDT